MAEPMAGVPRPGRDLPFEITPEMKATAEWVIMNAPTIGYTVAGGFIGIAMCIGLFWRIIHWMRRFAEEGWDIFNPIVNGRRIMGYVATGETRPRTRLARRPARTAAPAPSRSPAPALAPALNVPAPKVSVVRPEGLTQRVVAEKAAPPLAAAAAGKKTAKAAKAVKLEPGIPEAEERDYFPVVADPTGGGRWTTVKAGSNAKGAAKTRKKKGE